MININFIVVSIDMQMNVDNIKIIKSKKTI